MTNRKSGLVVCAFVFMILINFLRGAVRAELPLKETKDPYYRARHLMVERQLRKRGIKDGRVLAVMESVPRHLFVPEKLRSSAYQDRPLPIGEGQTISQPYIVAFMTELLELKGNEKVLEIGTGSGYQAAILARLADQVFSIEIIPSLAERAQRVLQDKGFVNIQVKVGDGYFGWPENSPFDAILVTAAAGKIPEPLWEQLGERGRLVMPLSSPDRLQRLVRVRKLAGRMATEELTGVLFVPLTGAIQKEIR
jgi:protein-L-isoaspartate(D-aspartate) O-methyltransferase